MSLIVSLGVTLGSLRAKAQSAELQAYQAHLASLRGLVAACRADAAACDTAKVGADDRVAPRDGAAGFEVHWSWLWDVILKAKDSKLAEREEILNAAAVRLDDQSREAGIAAYPSHVSAGAAVPFAKARTHADKVLARGEFRHVTRNSFWDHLAAEFFRWLNGLFGGAATLGQRAPWIGPVIEYGFLALAFTALLVWVRRVMERQRLAIRMESAAATSNWQETSRNWAKLAETAAAESDWREAVHSLYWASVTELEGRRIWRQNQARTPREYLRLLEPEMPQYAPLRALTQLLERLWYGLRPAARGDYDEARAVYEALRLA